MHNEQQWQAATYVIEALEQAGFEAVIVGGAARDYYLQKPLHDIDIATSATPDEMKTVFRKTFDVGIAHGTVVVVDGGVPVEVTTYRTEGTYTDHRRPESVTFVRTLQHDLERRDFTMNAMALTKQFTLIDYYGGQADIDAQLIRAVGHAQHRFEEDALRMLRAVRFAAQLGFTIEPSTLTAIQACAPTIAHISVERIYMELEKLFVSAHVAHGVALLVQTTLANSIPGSWQPADWQAFQASTADVGWAYVYFLHAKSEPTILSSYKCANKTKQFAQQVYAATKQLAVGLTPMEALQASVDVLETAYAFLQWQALPCDMTLEQALALKEGLPIAHKEELAITGRDLLEWTERKRGPWLKEALAQALEAVVTGRIANDKQQLKDWFTHDFID